MPKKKAFLWAMILLAFGIGFALGVALWEGTVASPEVGGAAVATR